MTIGDSEYDKRYNFDPMFVGAVLRKQTQEHATSNDVQATWRTAGQRNKKDDNGDVWR